MPNIHISYTEKDLKRLILDDIEKKLDLDETSLSESDISIQVKSKQNYKAEWEPASFRAEVSKIV